MTDQPQRFEGTSDYIATDDLKVAVDAAVTLRRPLLVKGEPGTGKTVLAHEIAKAIIALGQNLNLKVLAEGVEDAEQVDVLRSSGCDYLQGFFYSKPLTAEDVYPLLLRGSGFSLRQLALSA